MLNCLWIVIAFPLAGFALLALAGSRMPGRLCALVGAGTVGISAALALAMGVSFAVSPPEGRQFTQTLWSWMSVPPFSPEVSLRLDPLSLISLCVILVVAFLIMLYSSEFMSGDEGYSRFFAYMDLFVAAMLVLVLANDLVFLYLGWEGVGLCSFLLIGFWYKVPKNVVAARKAFLVTRVGDAALLAGIFLVVNKLGTLSIPEVLSRAAVSWPVNSGAANAAAALFAVGVAAKSAQIPLHVWLPDAMAGPSPVSALIHAATMVTAGVYLVARLHPLFTLSPRVLFGVAIVGAVTMLAAGLAALAQRDIKRILAYSTMSQIGYMFLALGVGAFSAAEFHFVVHAFFKSLLFLGAGVVIRGLNQEHDIFKMGGLRRAMPGTFWTFTIGVCSLCALPLVTAGFYSKDLILSSALAAQQGGIWLWLAGVIGAFITTLYAFRMLFAVFFGEVRTQVSKGSGRNMTLALVVLSLFSVTAGFCQMPSGLGGVSLFADFLAPTLPQVREGVGRLQGSLSLVAAIVPLVGIIVAWTMYLHRPRFLQGYARLPALAAVHGFAKQGFGFDALYDYCFVKPVVYLSRVNRRDVSIAYVGAISRVAEALHYLLSMTQTGRVRWYAAGVGIGAVVLIGIGVLL
jgi:NADH-quinone oxidoreductase subunit L